MALILRDPLKTCGIRTFDTWMYSVRHPQAENEHKFSVGPFFFE
ncbi:uncharacterized protein G2W53_012995 [Senna tora]|uniref:Uncharacterized protein n=1 Tax=Senna tora TaxID=362788 RepID=A0A834WQ91_9FABA|nr:uncharacterized protein G2W53_012995 [Senna tora]